MTSLLSGHHNERRINTEKIVGFLMTEYELVYWRVP